jgi:hypothetical protein
MTKLPQSAGIPAVYVLHENPDWIPPFTRAFEAEGVPLVEWDLTQGSIDLAAAPPEGVFWSRLSASSHTREHPFAKEYARAVLAWLEAHGRQVVNGRHVAELEVSKTGQYLALATAGFDVPHTLAVFGTGDVIAAAASLSFPLITKHNQGGKGLGVRRFDTRQQLIDYLEGPDFELPVDGITLLQEYVFAARPFITRAEFVDGTFVYAVQVDTSAGSFELCPAEACEVPDQGFAPSACTIGPDGKPAAFAIRAEVTAEHPLIRKLTGFLAEHRIDIAGVEFIEAADGRTVVYDINTNTNYNPAVEDYAPVPAAIAVARALGRKLGSAVAIGS